ncbi:ABC transporter permease [bacterium]|nr:ABC transporter permease [bacterium]
MLKRLKHMLIKEFLQLFRDPRMRMVVFGVPLLQMLVIAFALTNDVTNITTAVLDNDKTPASRELLSEFTSSGYFEIVDYLDSDADIERVLDHSTARVVLVFPAGFEDDLNGGRTAILQLIADGTDSNTVSIVFGYANQIVADYSSGKQLERAVALLGPAGMPGLVDFETRAWFNQNLESKFFYVPSLIGVMLIVITMILTSIAIVREKEVGTIEQIMVTPITRVEFILGKTIPYAIIGYILMTVMLILAILIFGVEVKGSLFTLYGLTGIYLLANLGIALLISTTSETQQQALLTAFIVMMPTILLSGFIFPVHNMPVPVQYASTLIPLRWYLEILRGVIMKGTGIEAITTPVLFLTLLAIAFITLATARFRKTLS